MVVLINHSIYLLIQTEPQRQAELMIQKKDKDTAKQADAAKQATKEERKEDQ